MTLSDLIVPPEVEVGHPTSHSGGEVVAWGMLLVLLLALVDLPAMLLRRRGQRDPHHSQDP